MKLRVTLEPSDDGGYTVIVPALPGCISKAIEQRFFAIQNKTEQPDRYITVPEMAYA